VYIVLALGLGLAGEALAQQPTTGSLVSTVADQAGRPLAGARISIAGPLGERTASTDASGRVEVRLLPSGDYRIRVEAPGFSTIETRGISIVAGERTMLPIAMTAGLVEEIKVTGAAPLVDLKRTEITTNFKTDEVISTLPVGRTFTDIAALAPGVVSGLGTGTFNRSIGGSSGLENAYFIDGTNVTNAAFGSVGTGLFGGTLTTGVTTDFLEELQVKTASFEAEYGQALGGILNGVVKSGGNDFTGSIRFFYQPAGLEAPGEKVVLEGGATNTDARERIDFSVQAAGPIVKDKLFWFVALNPVYSSEQVTRDAPASTNPVLALDPGASITYPYPDLQPEAARKGQELAQDNLNYAAKLAWQLTPRQRLELSGFGDRSDNDTAASGSNPFNLAGDLDGDGSIDVTKTAAGFLEDAFRLEQWYGAHQQALRYSGFFGSRWLVESQLSHRTSSFDSVSKVDDYPYHDFRPLNETGVDFVPRGGGGLPAGADEAVWDVAIKVTGSLGRHEIKAGYEYWDADYDLRLEGRQVDFPFPIDTDGDGVADSTTVIRSPTGATVTVIGGIPGCTACNVGEIPVYDTFSRLNPSGPTTSEENSLFVQDTWSIGQRWALKFGARASRQSMRGGGDFTLNLTQVGSVFTTDPTHFEALSYTFPTEISPRIGFTFDPTAEGRTKLYANYARYFERVPLDLAVHVFSNDVFVVSFQFRDPELTVWNGGPILLAGLTPTRIEEDTKLPYVDEFVLGWQQLLSPTLTFEVRGIYRDQGRVLEDVQSTSAEEFLNFLTGLDAAGNPPFPGFGAAPLGEFVLANPGVNTPTNVPFPFARPVREYRALELVLDKRLANRWQLMANYRYSRLRGNYEGLFRNDNGQGNPNLSTLFDFPDSPLTRGQFLTGPLNTDRPHVLHVLGTRFFDGGFEVGGALHCESGLLRTSMLAQPVFQAAVNEIPGSDPVYLSIDPGTGLWTRGSSGNFLADYQAERRGNLGRAPALTTFDLHLAYSLRPKQTSLKMAVDVFNLFNSQHPTGYSDGVEARSTIPNPNYGRIVGYEQPRTVRFATIWGW